MFLYNLFLFIYKMNLVIIIILITFTVLIFQNVDAKQMQIATLTGYETLPISNSSGTGLFVMGPASAHGIKYLVILSDIDKVTEINLHKGEKGQTGESILTLYNSSIPTKPIKGVLISDEFNSSAIRNGFNPAIPDQSNFYVNVVTEDFPKGELRGQLHWIYPIFKLFTE
jgi:hypothetical protein